MDKETNPIKGDVTKTRTCERCRESIPLPQVRLFSKGNDKTMVVCNKCSEELSHPKPVSKAKPLPTSSPAWYICSRCRYNFKADAAKVGKYCNLQCPYCGKSDKLERKL